MAHMLATGFVIFESGDQIGSLISGAKEFLRTGPSVTEQHRTHARYEAACLLEDAADVIAFDPLTANMLLSSAVEGMLNCSFLRANRMIPRRKELLETVRKADREIGRIADAFYMSCDARERLSLANQLADRILETRGFFEWDSEREPCPLR